MKTYFVVLVGCCFLFLQTCVAFSADPETARLLEFIHRKPVGKDFLKALEKLKTIASESPYEFTTQLIEYGNVNLAAREGFWILHLACSTKSDEEVFRAAVDQLNLDEGNAVPLDIIRAISVKRSGGSGSLVLKFRGLHGLLKREHAEDQSLVGALLKDDLYESAKGFWHLTLYSPNKRDSAQPNKEVLLLVHLAEDYEFRKRYGFGITFEDALIELIESQKGHKASWVRGVVEQIEVRLEQRKAAVELLQRRPLNPQE